MKLPLLLFLSPLWIAGLGSVCHAADAPEGPRIVARHTAVFHQPPHHVPTRGMPDGPLLGNGDVGVVLAGPPEAQLFYIGKNDFWTRTPGDAKVIAVGRVELDIPAMQGATYRQEQDMALAEVRGSFTKDGLTVRTRSWVDANENLLLTQVQCEGGPIAISIHSARGEQAAVPAQVEDNGKLNIGREQNAPAWFKRKADQLPPAAAAGCKSREVAVASRVLGSRMDFQSVHALGDGLEVHPTGETVTVATVVLTDLDASDPLSAARKLVNGLTPAKIEALSARHKAWWAGFWSRSFIEIPDKEIEKRWYAALYVMGSCSRPGKVAPGLWGNWITTDHPNWHGDFHLNYNFQAPFYGVYAANHADLSLPFYQAIEQSIPNGRAMAKRHGWKGVHFPVCIGPWGLSPENPDGDWGQRSDAAFAALNFIWQYQYTQDKEWLKTTGYPYLREVADFWEDYLKFENGRYVIYNDSIHEGSGPDFNPLLSLGLVRTLFNNMIPMSEELGVDADRRGKWRDICNKISAFPLQERHGKTVFRYSEKGMGWNGGNTLGIHHIFPAGAIGLDSDPKSLEISRNTIDAMNRWADYNGFASWYTACARVGYDPKAILAKLRAECDKHSFPNLLLYYGGGGIENCGGFSAINEMLLQSHEGVIRFFPCWPKEQPARFGDLRAVGAFLVSAELKGGVVSGVKIVSEKGLECRIQNPWRGYAVRVKRDGQPSESVSDERFSLKTKPHEVIELLPVISR